MKQELFDIDFTSSGLHYLICLSVVAGVEGLSYKEHDAKSYWHAVHSFGCLSLCPHVAALPEAGPDILSYFSFCRATLKIDFDCHKRAQKKGIANWMPQWFMKLIQNGTPKRMHFTFVKALRTYGFGTLQSKLQLQKCLLMNMRYTHLHNGGRIISKQMNCLLRKHLPPYIVSL